MLDSKRVLKEYQKRNNMKEPRKAHSTCLLECKPFFPGAFSTLGAAPAAPDGSRCPGVDGRAAAGQKGPGARCEWSHQFPVADPEIEGDRSPFGAANMGTTKVHFALGK